MLGGTWKTYCSCAAGTRRVRGGAWPKVQPLRMLENSWPPSAVSSKAFSRRSLADPPPAGKMRPSLPPLMQTEKSRHGAARGTAAIPRLYLPGCSPRICIHFLVSACARKKREAPVLFVIDGNKASLCDLDTFPSYSCCATAGPLGQARCLAEQLCCETIQKMYQKQLFVDILPITICI